MLLIDAIAYVETHNRPAIGDHGKALSEYQIHREVWQDVHARWGNPASQHHLDIGDKFEDIGGADGISRERAKSCAFCQEVIIMEFLQKHDVATTAENIYACWNLGCTGFERRKFDLMNCPKKTIANALLVAEKSKQTK